MYRLAYTSKENPRLLDDEADRDVRHARSMERAVEREVHKMHAFVRFRELKRDDRVITWFAWFEPEHEILPRTAPFFVNPFANATWTIATLDGAAVWEGGALRFIDAPLETPAPGHGLNRPDLYITNPVKHFKLNHEIASVKPHVIVALGATALRALTGCTDSIESARGQTLHHPTRAAGP